MQRGDEAGAVAMEADPREQADAAHLRDHLRILGRDRVEPGAQRAAALGDPCEEAVGQHHIEHRIGDGAGEGVAAKGRTMAAGIHAAGPVPGGETGSDREPATEAFRDRDDVGSDAGLLVREQRAGASHAGLDLVEDEEAAVLVAQLAQPPQALGRHDADAALALDRLDQDRRSLRADRRAQSFVIAERHNVETRQQRRIALCQLGAADGRDARHGPAVERTLEGHDPVPLRRARGREMAADHLDRALDRFRTRVAHEDGVRERGADQPLGEPRKLRDLEQVGDVPDPAGLLDQRRGEVGVTVAQARDGDAAAEVEHAAAVAAVEPRPLTAREREIVAPVHGQQGRKGGIVQRRGPSARRGGAPGADPRGRAGPGPDPA